MPTSNTVLRPPLLEYFSIYYCSFLPLCNDILNLAVADLIKLLDEKGTFILGRTESIFYIIHWLGTVKYKRQDKPVFHIQTSINIKAIDAQFPTTELADALITPDI